MSGCPYVTASRGMRRAGGQGSGRRRTAAARGGARSPVATLTNSILSLGTKKKKKQAVGRGKGTLRLCEGKDATCWRAGQREAWNGGGCPRRCQMPSFNPNKQHPQFQNKTEKKTSSNKGEGHLASLRGEGRDLLAGRAAGGVERRRLPAEVSDAQFQP